jgi:L-histidine Nalpha-methyltransferase
MPVAAVCLRLWFFWDFKEMTDELHAKNRFMEDVLDGLSRSPKELSPKYFYDERGSKLFDRICELPEYYPTRTELSIMESHAANIAEELGPSCRLVELGSGSNLKVRLLLDQLPDPAGFVPVDISGDYMEAACRELQADYPDLKIVPICADFTQSFTLPDTDNGAARTVVYFPGSTIGNFHESQAQELLSVMRGICGTDGALLIGVDLRKSRETLEAAYNDAQGVTEQFNMNVLRRINHELGGDFDPARFEHQAIYNEGRGRIEMHLISQGNQRVKLNGSTIDFSDGERIITEYSYKYSREGFASLAESAGFTVERVWTDPAELFSVHLCV